jgi:hypothetical protein
MGQKHGEIFLTIEGKILIVEGQGPWNLESIAHTNVDPLVIEQKEVLLQSKWAVLVIAHGDAMFVPDARQMLVDIVKEDIKGGRVATALVVQNCLSPIFIADHLTNIYNDAGDHVESFTSIEQAKLWLNQQIAEALLK